jgi:phosphatidylserine/phosphatidylglycerophosphate/cardiolipin synthase-like enzyme
MDPADSQRLAQESTVDAHIRPRDKTRCSRTRQKHRRPTQLLGGSEASHRGVIEDRLGADPLATISTWFNREVWPWPAKPHAYVDCRLISGSAERCYQHAKVVIADASTPDAKALVTSANFSETAQRHNFEAGWLTRSVPKVQEIQKQFLQLRLGKTFIILLELYLKKLIPIL